MNRDKATLLKNIIGYLKSITNALIKTELKCLTVSNWPKLLFIQLLDYDQKFIANAGLK